MQNEPTARLGSGSTVIRTKDDPFAYSVVIPTKDRPAELHRALRAVAAQTERPVEIVVVDASAPAVQLEPALHRVLSDLGIPLHMLSRPPSSARQRNAGIQMVRTPLVLLLDDDVVIPPGYVASLLRRWHETGIDAITGVAGFPRVGRDHNLERVGHGVRRLLVALHILDRHREDRVLRSSGKFCGTAPRYFDAAVPAIGIGAALLRTDVVRRHGLSDRFDGYVRGDGLDLSLRMSLDGPLIGTTERFEHRHPQEDHSPRHWYEGARSETYFRLRNRPLFGLSYTAFWASVLKEGAASLLVSARARDSRLTGAYLNGVRDSVADVRREYFLLRSRPYYRTRAVYDRGRNSRRPRGGQGQLSIGLRTLSYHRIGTGDALCVKPSKLRQQLESALTRGAVPISLTDALDLLGRREPLTKPYLVVTFDDGYLDNLEHGLPILTDLGIPATIFLVAAIADRRELFNWYRRNPPAAIHWDDARALAGHELVEFQAHGRLHRRLTALSDAQARDEIAGAKDEIEHHLGTPVSSFCFAAGVWGEREIGIVKESGFRGAVTNKPGVDHEGADPFRLKRLTVSWSDDARSFALKLTGDITESRLEEWVRRRRMLAPVVPTSEEGQPGSMRRF